MNSGIPDTRGPDRAHLESLRRLHLQRFGEEVTSVTPVKGDGSDRVLFRLASDSNTSIGVIGANAEENRAFLGFSRTFRDSGLPVPEILGEDGSECYLEEDLGSVLLHDWQKERRGEHVPEEVMRMYSKVLQYLVRFQIDCAESIDYRLCYQYPEFAEEAMRFDLDYFRTMFLDRFLSTHLDEKRFGIDCSRLLDILLQADRSFFLYRDFQSRNIMIRDGEPLFIDYQSGRRGALQYDVASLLYEAKAALPESVRLSLLNVYIEETGTRIPVDTVEFRRLYYHYALIRVFQALGAFGNLGLRKGKSGFLEMIPSGVANLAVLADHLDMQQHFPYFFDIVQELERLDFGELASG